MVKEKRGHLNKFGRAHPKHKEVIQYEIKSTHVVAVWESLTQASYQNHVNRASVSRCCNGLQLTAGGYRWKFKDKKVLRVSQINKKTDKHIQTWDSIASASKGLKLNNGRIRKCCNGIKKSEGGFKWEWHNDNEIK